MVVNLADQEQLIAQHPQLYHIAESGAWDNIRRHGLLSTTALLELFDVSEPRRSDIESKYRKTDIPIFHPEYGYAAIRNQTPMPPGKLKLALTDMEPSDWYKLLSGKVFFWPTESRLQTFLNAKSHKGKGHDILTVCTRSLVEQYQARITLSPINSGTVFVPTHQRGSETLQTIANYRSRKGSEYFAELAVEGSVADMERHTLSVDRWMGPTYQRNIWRRQLSVTEV